MIRICCILIICFGAAFVSAQVPQELLQFRYRNFDVNDKLAEKYIYTATQDMNGQMWFGTSTGLYTYDNRYFKKYEPDFNVAGRNISNILQYVYYDKWSRKIWCGALNCFMWFDPIQKKFGAPDYHNKTVQKLADNFVRSFFRDSKGNLWLGTAEDSWFIFDEKTLQAIYYNPKPGKAIAVTNILESSDGRIWVSCTEGLFECSKGPANIKAYPPIAGNRAACYINNMAYDSLRQCLWIASGGEGLFKFNLSDNSFKQYPIPVVVNGKKLSNGSVICINQISDKYIMLSEFMYFDIEHEKIIQPKELRYSIYNLGVKKAVAVYSDVENNKWVCSHGGIAMLPNQSACVKSAEFASPEGITHGYDKLLALSENEVLIQRKEAPSLIVVDQLTAKTRHFVTGSNLQANDMCRYKGKNILLACTDGLYLMNCADKSLRPFIDNYKKNVFAVMQNASGQVYWSVEGEGIYSLNRAGRPVLLVPESAGKKSKQNALTPLAVDAKGNLWYAQNREFYFWNFDKGKQEGLSALLPQSLIENILCRGLKADKNGNIWISTTNKGLFVLLFNQPKFSYKNFTTKNCSALGSDLCVNILNDNAGKIWVGFLDGITRWNVDELKFEMRLTEAYGLLTNGMDPQDCTPENKLYSSIWSAYSEIDLNKLGHNTYKPNAIFSNINIGGVEYASLSTEYTVPFNRAYFSIDVGSTGYNHGTQNSILYKLDGVDVNWRYLGSNYSISYAGLKPGTYVLHIKALNNESIEGQTFKIRIQITPPFYKTWWFILLLFALGAALIFYFYKLKLKHAKKEASLKSYFQHQLAETEMKALRAQMNPHFIFNCLNSINKFILQRDTVAASQYLTKFSRLIRLILDDSNEKKVTLYNELELIRLYMEMESLRFDKKFNYILNVASDLNTAEILLPSMLVQPYIENAIWHGLLHLPEARLPEAMIEVKFSRAAHNELHIEICDNGVGRQKATELKSKNTLKRKSYGMQLTQKRLDMINHVQQQNASAETIDLFDKNGEAAGTKVILRLPLEFLSDKTEAHAKD